VRPDAELNSKKHPAKRAQTAITAILDILEFVFFICFFTPIMIYAAVAAAADIGGRSKTSSKD
jgi:uncharacterized protein involved in response to NO